MDSWSLEIDLVTRRLHEDPRVVWGPEGRGRARRGSINFSEIVLRPLRPYGNPEVLIQRSFDWNPEVLEVEPEGSSLDPEIFDWNPEAIGEPRGLGVPWEPEIFGFSQGLYSAFLGKTTTVPVWISHSAARKLATIEFLCYIILLQEVTDRLEGAGVGVMTQGCGCYDPSSRLTLLSTSGEAGFRLLHGPRCALGCTEVLGSFDSIIGLAHTHSYFMSHTRFYFLWACHCGRATFCEGWPRSGVSGDLIQIEPEGSSLDPEIFDWNPEAIGEPRGLGVPWEPEIFGFSQGLYSAFLGKPTTVPVWISHSASRKLATIEFLCYIILLQEVTDRLRGCWCGCFDPSARLTLLSTSGEAGFRLLHVFHSTFAMNICHVFPVLCSS
ncbi:hypothetical protein F2Q69_00052863 [Brassica cretica]|uniref:Uncharacterized protein n=1 Tax=Brassica cretica TaxID=69181 RepID=A0A8S9MV40_BRACR|nr:hypothetical protein F2Q69_00052863 [Brassica cretica]